MTNRLKLFAGLLAVMLIAACNTTRSAVPLPALRIDPSGTSVSGLSAGAFMAVQVHVAHSAVFRRGAGIVAGGPYYCTEGSAANALGRCMAHTADIPVAKLVAVTRDWAAGRLIDPVANLNTSRVYLFTGKADSTVQSAVVEDLRTYYRSFVPEENIFYNNTLAAGHAMITDSSGGNCAETASPYINNCRLDLAGAILQHLYGRLNPRNNGAPAGTLTQFDQTAFVSGHGMAASGLVYVPQSCAAGTACRLHVVFHGCRQNTAAVGQQFAENAGYNRWADTNNIVVLYPQTSNAAPNGCWDWWGYDSAGFARQSGPQMAAVMAMVARLSAPAGAK